MDVKTKFMLLNHTDSYWTLLPLMVKELILQYRDSQTLIEHRESVVSRELCEQIRLYAQLQRKWFIGPIRCETYCYRVCGPLTSPLRCRKHGLVCRHECVSMRVYGHYWDLNGVKKRIFLGFTLERALAECSDSKEGVWFQMSADAIIRMFGLLDGARD